MPYKDVKKRRAAQRRYDRKRCQTEAYKKQKKEYSQTEAYKQRRKERRKEYSQTEAYKQRRKEYSQTEAYKQRRKEYMKEYHTRPDVKIHVSNQKKNNPVYKRRNYLRSIVRQAVIKQKKVSAKTCNDLIGCSAQQARDHLEQQFEPWMNWNNYGSDREKWCIDHIVPISSIDIFDEKDVKIIFHYTNMQPLGFIKNCEKGDRV